MAFVTSLSLCPSSARTFTPSARTPLTRRVFVTARRQRAHLTMTLGVGGELPAFSLPTSGGNTLSSSDLSGGTTILYFYPRDATPGCTVEAQNFRDLNESLANMGVGVVGVSKDSVESHDQFVADQNLPFPLISDDGTLSEAFGVWKLRKRGDREFMGIERSTFIIKDGKVVKEWRGMKADGHAAEVVEAVKQV